MLRADRASIVYQTESLCISEDSDSRWLHIGEESILSAMALQQPEAILLPATQMMMMALLFTQPAEILLLGLGGGDSLRFFRHHFPATPITAVEVDAQMVRVAQQWFSLPAPGNGFTLVIDDAEHFVAHTSEHFDLIMLDIILDSRMPESFQEAALFAGCERLLTQSGVLVVNYVVSDATMLKDMLLRLQQIFQAPVVVLPVAGHRNVILFVLRGCRLPFAHYDIHERADTLQQRYQLPFLAALDSLCRTNTSLCD